VSDKKAVVRKVARIEGKIPCHGVGFSHTWKLKIIKRLIGERVSKLTVRSYDTLCSHNDTHDDRASPSIRPRHITRIGHRLRGANVHVSGRRKLNMARPGRHDDNGFSV